MLDQIFQLIRQHKFNDAHRTFDKQNLSKSLSKRENTKIAYDLLKKVITEGIHTTDAHKRRHAIELIKSITSQCSIQLAPKPGYHLEHLKLLNEGGMLTNINHFYGYNMLHGVLMTPTKPETHKAAIDMVLTEQALNQQAVFENDNTPVHLAVMQELDDRLDYVVTKANQKGINLDLSIKNREGKTPLILAANRRKINTVSSLLKMATRGDNCVNLQDNNGKTALHYACALGSIDMVKNLVSHGARFDIQDNKGFLPKDEINIDAEQVADILRDAGINPERAENADSNYFLDDCHQRFLEILRTQAPKTDHLLLTIPKYKNNDTAKSINTLKHKRLVDPEHMLKRRLHVRSDNKQLVDSLQQQYNQLSSISITNACLKGHKKVQSLLNNQQTQPTPISSIVLWKDANHKPDVTPHHLRPRQ